MRTTHHFVVWGEKRGLICTSGIASCFCSKIYGTMSVPTSNNDYKTGKMGFTNCMPASKRRSCTLFFLWENNWKPDNFFFKHVEYVFHRDRLKPMENYNSNLKHASKTPKINCKKKRKLFGNVWCRFRSLWSHIQWLCECCSRWSIANQFHDWPQVKILKNGLSNLALGIKPSIQTTLLLRFSNTFLNTYFSCFCVIQNVNGVYAQKTHFGGGCNKSYCKDNARIFTVACDRKKRACAGRCCRQTIFCKKFAPWHGPSACIEHVEWTTNQWISCIWIQSRRWTSREGSNILDGAKFESVLILQ